MSNTQNVGLLLWLWLLVSGRLCTLSINRENPCIHLFFNSISRLWFELTWQLRILYKLEVIGGSTLFSFSFVTLMNKTTLTILIFAARNATQTKSFTLILTQTYAMTQQIAVRDVRAVFHKGNDQTFFPPRNSFFYPPIPRKAHLSTAWVAFLHQALLIRSPEAARLKCIYVLLRALGIFMGPLKFRFSQWYKARPFTHNE